MVGNTATFYDAEKKIWSGPKKKDFYGPDMTLGEVALRRLSQIPNKVIQVMDTTGEELTAAQMLDQIKAVAANFQRLNLKVGDVVGIVASNNTHLASVVIASFLCGLPINGLYPGFDKDSIGVIFKATSPKIIFCDVDNYEVLKESIEELNLNAEIFIMNGEIKGARNVKDLLCGTKDDKDCKSFPCDNLTGDDTAVIICSSGTTGNPKGVQSSHKALLNLQAFPNICDDSVLFTFSFLYWASGIWTLIASILNGAKRVITDRPYTNEYFIHLVEKYQISEVIIPPYILIHMLEHPKPDLKQRLSSLRTILCGGAKVPQFVAEKFNALMGDERKQGLVVSYGMSELSGLASQNDGGPEKRRDGTEGHLLPNMKVRILNSNGELCGINESGVITLKLPYKWKGYYRNEEATKTTIVNGWLVSGDVGFFDEDGYLHICSRDKEIFKCNNFQIIPEHIEEVIIKLPGVLEVSVFGVPDIMATNLTACAIVRTNNEMGKGLTEEQVEKHVSKHLSAIYHIKGGVYFVDALPKNASGKVLRRKILENIEDKVNK